MHADAPEEEDGAGMVPVTGTMGAGVPSKEICIIINIYNTFFQGCGAARFLERLRLRVLFISTAAPAPAHDPAPASDRLQQYG